MTIKEAADINVDNPSKNDLRSFYRSQAVELTETDRANSPKVGRILCGYFRGLTSEKYIGCYQPLAGEPDLELAYGELREHGFHLAFPTIHGDHLRFYKADRDEQWKKGSWDLREPHPELSEEVSLDKLENLLIPALAFDKNGVRLGRGKGYYDRALKNFNGTKIGVAFARTVATRNLPCEPHDIRMDMIITEEGVHMAHEEGFTR